MKKRLISLFLVLLSVLALLPGAALAASTEEEAPVSYTHLTLPTN